MATGSMISQVTNFTVNLHKMELREFHSGFDFVSNLNNILTKRKLNMKFYLIIWSFDGVEISNLTFAFDTRKTLLVIKSSFGGHLFSFKDLYIQMGIYLLIHIRDFTFRLSFIFSIDQIISSIPFRRIFRSHLGHHLQP